MIQITPNSRYGSNEITAESYTLVFLDPTAMNTENFIPDPSANS